MQTGMVRWLGRVAIVTGASSGIGAAISKNLVRNGLQVVGVSRRPHRVEQLSADLQAMQFNGRLYTIKGDVTNLDDVEKVVKWTRSSLGGVDVLVNSAGVFDQTPLTRICPEQLRRLFEVNVFGPSTFTNCVLDDMMAHGTDDGHIINITGVAGLTIPELQSGIHAYSASKHAVRVLTEGMRRDLKHLSSKIRITGVHPGVVRTEMYEASGMSADEVERFFAQHAAMRPENVADAVEYALAMPIDVQMDDITVQPLG